MQTPKPTIHDEEHQLLNNNDDQHHHHIDTLSLRDLPLQQPHSSSTVDHPPPPTHQTNHSRRSSSSSYSDPTSDFFFEFLINHDDDLITTAADDVIFHGRLLPFAPPPPRRSLSLSSVAARLTRPQLTESPTESIPTIRPSRSLNYRKIHRKRQSNNKQKADANMLRRNSSNNNNSEIPAKLPWYMLAFGLPVKFPAEMELKDMKNRQFRRNITPRWNHVHDDRSSCSWRVLSVLSCRSNATVDVRNTTPPFRNSLT